MEQIYPWLGDWNEIRGLGREWVGVACILVSVLCGAIIGLERERREKPAGLRTLALIAIGSTVFTFVSLLLAAKKPIADPARLAAQIIPGIGFLGAGAIIQARGTVVGLTTGATIWAVAAVGVTIGSGYVAAGVGFTLVILLTLTSLHWIEPLVLGRCRRRRMSAVYRPERGKTRPRLQEILDRHAIPDGQVVHGGSEDKSTISTEICIRHREHRSILKDIAELDEVVSLEVERA